MTKELVDAIRTAQQKPEHWEKVETLVEHMTPEDFAVTYDKNISGEHIPLCMVTYSRKPHLAELIINKNPVFAGKIVDKFGATPLYGACGAFQEPDAIKILNLLMPYMSREALLSRTPQGDTFFHLAIKNHYYALITSISPELISTILKSSSADPSYASVIKFIYETINVYDAEIFLNPEIADNYFRKGVILQGIGKEEKAVKCYKKAIKLDSKYIEKVGEILPLAAFMETGGLSVDSADQTKNKIDTLTKEITNLNEKALSLAKELAKLTTAHKAVEECKEPKAEDLPPAYEDTPHPGFLIEPAIIETTKLVGDTCDVAFHT